LPPIEQREATPGKESSSPSDNDLTEVPLSTSIDGKTKRGNNIALNYCKRYFKKYQQTAQYFVQHYI
jgi:hypothetical protein